MFFPENSKAKIKYSCILDAWLSVNCDNRDEERTLLSIWLVSQVSKDLKRSVAGRLFQKQMWRQS